MTLHRRALSVVTHRAVARHFPLYVARDAEAHIVDVVHLEHLGHAAHVAVAGGAGVGAESLDVPLVREVGVPRDEVHASPLDRLLVRPGLANLLDLRLGRAIAATDHEVASHAGLHRRNAGLGRDRHRVVAVLALHLELAGVDVVAEEDRLAWTLERSGVGDYGGRKGVGDRLRLLRLAGRATEHEQGCERGGADAANHESHRTHYRSHAEGVALPSTQTP